MIADMINNKKLNPVVIELFIKYFYCLYYTIILHNQNFNKLLKIIHQIFILKVL